jgi:hypothetical protein
VSYDSKCLQLASYFLWERTLKEGNNDVERKLAQLIQDTIEQYLEEIGEP